MAGRRLHPRAVFQGLLNGSMKPCGACVHPDCQGKCHVFKARITPVIALGGLPQTGLESDQVCLGRNPVNISLAKHYFRGCSWHVTYTTCLPYVGACSYQVLSPK
jgi:hypothetical protein